MGFCAALWQELVNDFPDDVEVARVTVRLVVAILLGGILGLQKAHVGKAAGMRTHMLVTLGSALVVLVPNLTGMTSADLSRIIQGTLTGIGFLGGGVILKMSEQHQIVGITTAASIWLTAILGIVTGTGRLGLAVVGAILCDIILSVLGRLEHEMIANARAENHEATETPSNRPQV